MDFLRFECLWIRNISYKELIPGYDNRKSNQASGLEIYPIRNWYNTRGIPISEVLELEIYPIRNWYFDETAEEYGMTKD